MSRSVGHWARVALEMVSTIPSGVGALHGPDTLASRRTDWTTRILRVFVEPYHRNAIQKSHIVPDRPHSHMSHSAHAPLRSIITVADQYSLSALFFSRDYHLSCLVQTLIPLPHCVMQHPMGCHTGQRSTGLRTSSTLRRFPESLPPFFRLGKAGRAASQRQRLLQGGERAIPIGSCRGSDPEAHDGVAKGPEETDRGGNC